jgi:heme/copper-type cytochrome/quinol oxidase subunit 2
LVSKHGKAPPTVKPTSNANQYPSLRSDCAWNIAWPYIRQHIALFVFVFVLFLFVVVVVVVVVVVLVELECSEVAQYASSPIEQ